MAKHRASTETEQAYVHFQVPETPENKGYNLYCPYERELTALFMGHATGMETYACGACREPEPVMRVVTQADFDAIAAQISGNA
jgi:hypothetical protein